MQTASRLIAQVESARAELAEVVDRFLSLQAEFRSLTQLELEHQRLQANQSEIAKEVESTLRRLLSGQMLRDLVGRVTDSEPEDAKARRARLEEISAEMTAAELKEELLQRALEHGGPFLLSRRPGVDPALVAAPYRELEEALVEAKAALARIRPALKKSKAA